MWTDQSACPAPAAGPMIDVRQVGEFVPAAIVHLLHHECVLGQPLVLESIIHPFRVQRKPGNRLVFAIAAGWLCIFHLKLHRSNHRSRWIDHRGATVRK